jgi:hypothetical protein
VASFQPNIDDFANLLRGVTEAFNSENAYARESREWMQVSELAIMTDVEVLWLGLKLPTGTAISVCHVESVVSSAFEP